jgi:Bacterial extracellular solute-binding proteins, family 3
MIPIRCQHMATSTPLSVVRRLLAGLYLYAVFMSAAAVAEPLKVVVPPWVETGAYNEYFVRVLALAFSKTEAADGIVDIQEGPQNLTGARLVADLKSNKTFHVIWHGTSIQRERDLIAIPISLTKELNEYRVLLIRKEDQEKFNKVNSIDDLRKFTAGSAADWPSKDILRHNELPVVTVANSTLLIPMLKMKRFDYMSRNIFEVWDEAVRYDKEGLTVEKKLLLRGGVPFYFFVSKANPQLAERIERGLKMAIADGSFEKLFLSVEGFNRGRAELDYGHRHVLQLKSYYSRESSKPPLKEQ